jgi:hypothetical protein
MVGGDLGFSPLINTSPLSAFMSATFTQIAGLKSQ